MMRWYGWMTFFWALMVLALLLGAYPVVFVCFAGEMICGVGLVLYVLNGQFR